MLLLKRCLTAFVLFFILFVVIYFGICVMGGAISGARIGAEHPNDPNNFQLGQEAGRNFVLNHLGTIVLSAVGGSLVCSLLISFSGLLPWCRKSPQPPPML